MDNAIVFTGLPRTPSRFKKSITEMNSLRQVGLLDHVIFSTWDGRLDDKPDLRSFLNELDVTIIEKPEAPEGGKENIWHQMRSLDYGLKHIPDESYVVKTRPEVHIEKEFLRKLFTKEIDYIGEAAGSGVFTERLWVPHFELGAPFFLCDYCFFGLKRDIKKLTNFDVRFDILYGIEQSAAEVIRYIHPYLESFPFLEHYLLNYRGHKPNYRQAEREALLRSRLTSEVYGAFFAFYYKLLAEDFYFNFEPVTFADGGWIRDGESEVQVANNSQDFLANFQGLGTGRQFLFCDENSWLEAHFEYEKSNNLPEPIVTGVDREFSAWQDYNMDSIDIRSDVRRDSAFFDTIDYPDGQISRWIIRNVLEPFQLIGPARYIYRKLK